MADTNPLVSIALCTYNGATYLEVQLDTLIHQTYPNLEIIVTDDQSTDDTIEILNRYATADPRFKIHRNKQNLGYIKNFEKAISLCTGDYIMLCDQDDYWDLNKVKLMINAVGDSALIYHDSEFVNNKLQSLGYMSDNLNMYAGDSPLPFLFQNCVSGHSCMFRKTLVPALGRFDVRFPHDWWIAFVAAHFGPINYLNRPLVKYRQHEQSSTDFLRIKAASATPVESYIEISLPWFKYCRQFNGRYQGWIDRLIYLLENKSLANTFRLMNLLMGYCHELYFMKKKGYVSKLNYIRKMVFYLLKH